MILKYRFEYRDLIIYAYNLKHEIKSLRRNESLRKMQLDQLLSNSMRELVQKRRKFNTYFEQLMKEKSARWLTQVDKEATQHQQSTLPSPRVEIPKKQSIMVQPVYVPTQAQTRSNSGNVTATHMSEQKVRRKLMSPAHQHCHSIYKEPSKASIMVEQRAEE